MPGGILAEHHCLAAPRPRSPAVGPCRTPPTPGHSGHASNILTLSGRCPARLGVGAARGSREREGGAKPSRAAGLRRSAGGMGPGLARPGQPARLAARAVGRRGPAGGERPERAPPTPPRLAVRLHLVQPVGGTAWQAAPGGRRRLPALRPPGIRRTPCSASLRPDVLVFSKLDLWPELATRAAAAGTRVLIVAATVSRGSGRLRWPVRTLLRPGYASVALAGAISADDGARLQVLGVPAAGVRVTGDPRFDSVVEKVSEIRPDATRSAGSERARRRWWPAPPGPPTSASSSTPLPACTSIVPTPASFSSRTSPPRPTSLRSSARRHASASPPQYA